MVASLILGSVAILARTGHAAPPPTLTTQTGGIDGGTTTTLPVALQGRDIVQIASGGYHSLALTSYGTVYVWGANWSGQLGDGTTTDSSVPVAIDMTGVLAGKTITQLAASGSHALALASDGTAYAWGYNFAGQLGNGTTTNSSVPVAVDMTGVLAGKTITQVTTGNHSLALASDGTAYAWGYNFAGQLGDGTTTSSSVPVAVDMTGVLAGKTITQVAANSYYSLALASDGTVQTWGHNTYGQLGNGTTTHSSVPVAVDMTGVMAGKTITQVAANSYYSLALASDGTAYAWGYNFAGQLGNGTTTNSSVPVAVDMTGVLAGKTITQLAAGDSHALALTSGSTAYAWGSNFAGQLGDGTTTNSSVPVTVANLPESILTGVTFDGIVATSFEVLPNGDISMVAPAHAAGPVDVVFTFADGRSITITNGFTYTADAPGDPTPSAPDSGVGSTQQNTALIVAIAGLFAAAILALLARRHARR